MTQAVETIFEGRRKCVREGALYMSTRAVAISAAAIFLVAIVHAGVIYEVYKVGAGDTLESIAARYNSESEHIRKRNALSPDTVLYIGQSLVIPVGSKEYPQRENPKNPHRGVEDIKESTVIIVAK